MAPRYLVCLCAALVLTACCCDRTDDPILPFVPTPDASDDVSRDLPEPDVMLEPDVGEPDVPLASVCGDGVCDDDEAEETCPADCNPAPVAMHDPEVGDLLAFPDDFFTVEDTGSPTGLRVDIRPENLPAYLNFPANYREVFVELGTLDGFGTGAGGFLRFTRALDTAALPSGLDTVLPESPIQVGYLDDGQWVPVPVELAFTDEDRTVIFRPMAPLPAGVEAAAVLTTELRGADGLSAEPSAFERGVMDGSATGTAARLIPRYAAVIDALAAAGIVDGPESIASMTAFTTQTITSESVAIAEDIQSRTFEIAENRGCQTREDYLQCEIVFETGHYRTEDRIVDTSEGFEPHSTYMLSAEIYLPLEAGEFGSPYPVLLFGHGLGGERTQARRLAQFAAPLGFATVAIDAPEHGEHPVSTSNDLVALMGFFGFDQSFFMRGRVLRDNWRQATYDKLALIELIKTGLDIDGDDVQDLDGDRMMYLGVSLGGIMGVELLALSEDLIAGVLVVPGGRVTDILQYGETFGPLIRLLTPNGTSSGDVDRFFPVLQTVIERGDSSNYARHVFRDRLRGEAPNVLFGMVIDDAIVPETTNFLLARALDIPHLPPVIRPIGLIDTPAQLPFSGNLEGGRTAGLLQFDVVFEDGEWVEATHNNIGDSDVGAEAWLRFMEESLRTGVGVVVDPYAPFGGRP